MPKIKKLIMPDLKSLITKENLKKPPVIAGLALVAFLGFATLFPNLFTKANEITTQFENLTWDSGDYASSLHTKIVGNNLEIENDHREWWGGASTPSTILDSTNNVQVTSVIKNGLFFPSITDVSLSSDIIAVWDTVNESSAFTGDLYAQRIDAHGNKVWPSDVKLNNLNTINRAWQRKDTRPQVFNDSSTSSSVVFYAYGGAIYAVKISNLDGSLPWGQDGVVVGTISGGVGGSAFKAVQLQNGNVLVVSFNSYVSPPSSSYQDIRLSYIDISNGTKIWHRDPSYSSTLFVDNINLSGQILTNPLAFDIVITDNNIAVAWMEGCDNQNKNCDIRIKEAARSDGTDIVAFTPAGYSIAHNGGIWDDIVEANSNSYASEIELNSFGDAVFVTYRSSDSGILIQRVNNNAENGWIGSATVYNGDFTTDFHSIIDSNGIITTTINDGNIHKIHRLNDGATHLWGTGGVTLDFEARAIFTKNSGETYLYGIKDLGGLVGKRLAFRAYDGNEPTPNILLDAVFDELDAGPGFDSYIDFNRFDALNLSDGMVFFWDQTIDNSGNHSIYAQKFTPDGGGPFPQGSIISNEIVKNDVIDWDRFYWNATIPGVSHIDIQTRTKAVYAADTNLALASNGAVATSTSNFFISIPQEPPNDPIEITFAPSIANDGIVTTNWGQNGNLGWINDITEPTNPQNLTIDLGHSETVGRVALHSLDLYNNDNLPVNGEGDGTPFFPTNYKIQTSTDGTNWVDQITVPGDTDSNPDVKTIEHSFTAIPARYIRLNIVTLPTYTLALPGEAAGQKNIVMISEFEVFASSGGHISTDWNCEWEGANSCAYVSLTNSSGTSGSFPITAPDGNYFQYRITFTKGSTPSLGAVSATGAIVSDTPPPEPQPAPPSPAYSPSTPSSVEVDIDSSLGTAATPDGSISIQSNASINSLYGGSTLRLESSPVTGNLGVTLGGVPLKLFDISILGVTNPVFGDPLQVTLSVLVPEGTSAEDLVLYHDANHNDFASGYTTLQNGSPEGTVITVNATTHIATISFSTTTLSRFILSTKEKPTLIQQLMDAIKKLEERIAALEAKKRVKPPEPIKEVVAPKPLSTKYYTVQPGDYLISIAKKVYGDSSRYFELIAQNKDRYPEIANPPNMLRVGWVLKYQ